MPYRCMYICLKYFTNGFNRDFKKNITFLCESYFAFRRFAFLVRYRAISVSFLQWRQCEKTFLTEILKMLVDRIKDCFSQGQNSRAQLR